MTEELAKTEQEKQVPARDDHGRLLPGHTANLKGRPKFSLISLLKEELQREIEVGDNKEKITVAKALIKKLVKKAVQEEDVAMIKEILNRIEGMPRQQIGMDIDAEVRELKVEIITNAIKGDDGIPKKL